VVVGGGFSFDWGLVQPRVAASTRICTYDPSGTAWSDPFPGRTIGNSSSDARSPTCAERVEEIHRLLASAGIDGPYVLVGFSIGGVIGRLYATKYPNEVTGMVLVDHAFIDVSGDFHSDSSEGPLAAAHLDQPPVLISKTPIVLTLEDDQNFSKLPQRNRDLHLWAMSAHPLRPTAETAAECIAAVDNATKQRPYPLGEMPLVVISTAIDSPNYRNLQAKLLTLSHDSSQIIAENSSHMVIVDEPEVIISAIHRVVEAVQKHTSLK
jgi:pimeloyl-ACP methyl ester carboxylesterase